MLALAVSLWISAPVSYLWPGEHVPAVAPRNPRLYVRAGRLDGGGTVELVPIEDGADGPPVALSRQVGEEYAALTPVEPLDPHRRYALVFRQDRDVVARQSFETDDVTDRSPPVWLGIAGQERHLRDLDLTIEIAVFVPWVWARDREDGRALRYGVWRGARFDPTAPPDAFADELVWRTLSHGCEVERPADGAVWVAPIDRAGNVGRPAHTFVVAGLAWSPVLRVVDHRPPRWMPDIRDLPSRDRCLLAALARRRLAGLALLVVALAARRRALRRLGADAFAV